MTDRDAQIDQFIAHAGWSDAQRTRVAGDASNRKYDRLTRPDGNSVILMDAPPETGENVRPFVQIANHLSEMGLSAPTIFHQDADLGLLLIEDFGDLLFADLINDDLAQEIPLYRAATNVLIHLQGCPCPDLTLCDADWLTNMIAPLFEWYAPNADPQSIKAFEASFRPLADRVTDAQPVLVLRDYHAQNLLLLPKKSGVAQVGLLDFQDAVCGHPAYDLVSILQDARRDVHADVESEIIQHMLTHTPHDPEQFRIAYATLGLQRNLRILGIFARLCLRDGKSGYVDMIPRVWAYVLRNLEHPDLRALSNRLLPLLPVPTPIFLEQLKNRCPTNPSP